MGRLLVLVGILVGPDLDLDIAAGVAADGHGGVQQHGPDAGQGVHDGGAVGIEPEVVADPLLAPAVPAHRRGGPEDLPGIGGAGAVEPKKLERELERVGGLVSRHQDIVTSLARLDGEQLTLSAALPEKPDQAVGQVIGGGIEIYLPLAGMIDVEAERTRCRQEIAQLEKRIVASKSKLANPGFVQKAPAEVVERERERLADLELQAAKTWDRLRELG